MDNIVIVGPPRRQRGSWCIVNNIDHYKVNMIVYFRIEVLVELKKYFLNNIINLPPEINDIIFNFT